MILDFRVRPAQLAQAFQHSDQAVDGRLDTSNVIFTPVGDVVVFVHEGRFNFRGVIMVSREVRPKPQYGFFSGIFGLLKELRDAELTGELVIPMGFECPYWESGTDNAFSAFFENLSTPRRWRRSRRSTPQGGMTWSLTRAVR